ncbi:MAG: T9SS type A sorting domain-containing protein [Bacteroidota bacterium]
MVKLKTLLLTTGLSAIGFTNAIAQDGTITSGAEISGPGGHLSNTVGQMDFITVSSTGGKMHQGIQQAQLEVMLVSDVEEPGEAGNITIYPNPTALKVTLSVADAKDAEMSYTLLDLEGKQLEASNIKNSKTEINLEAFPASVYIITVLKDNREVKTFKVIKSAH